MSKRTALKLVETRFGRGAGSRTISYLLPLAWLAAAAGFYGPWVQQPAAGLAVSGVDMGELVKFLPAVRSGSLVMIRQLLYAPVVAVTVGIALLGGLRVLGWGRGVRGALLLAALILSSQLLPPAWSPRILLAAEFRAQVIALAVCWVLMAAYPLWRALPPRIVAISAALVSAAAAVLSAWQFALAKSSVDWVYGAVTPVGWGLGLCMVGLAAMTVLGAILAWRWRRTQAKRPGVIRQRSKRWG